MKARKNRGKNHWFKRQASLLLATGMLLTGLTPVTALAEEVDATPEEEGGPLVFDMTDTLGQPQTEEDAFTPVEEWGMFHWNN